MYCILMAGMPAAGKSTMAKAIAEKWSLPVISKDSIKEFLYDSIGFQSRAEQRGFDSFFAGGRQIKVDTTDFSKIDMEDLFSQIAAWKEGLKI